VIEKLRERFIHLVPEKFAPVGKTAEQVLQLMDQSPAARDASPLAAALRLRQPTEPDHASLRNVVTGEQHKINDSAVPILEGGHMLGAVMVFRDVGELRVKESDRLGLMAENLRAVGAVAEVQGDDLFVTGSARTPAGKVRTAGDHRLAMAFAVLGTVPGARIAIDDMRCADVSFPRFRETLASIRGQAR